MAIKDYFMLIDGLQNRIAKVEKVFGMFAMAFIIVINIYGIFSRTFLDQPLIYIQELTILGAVWLFFIGMGLVFKVHSDVTVDFMVRMMPRRLKLVNEILVDLLSMLFVLLLAWATWKFIPYTRGASHILSFALELPDEIYYYPVGLGALSIFLTLFHNFFDHVIRFHTNWVGGHLENKEAH
ncbi:MAG: TRAP transporter small permease subunit [Deltaproteobacteria bacterium]|nr:TRAP transporter small permease subunit [Deltaproteobacteria bacterium]